MPYRKPSRKRLERHERRIEALKRGRDRANAAKEPRGRPPELPDLRRKVEITDYDAGQPVVHTITLFRADRVDCYRAEADGKPWKDRIGWSRVLELTRKAYQRIPGKRSDFWW
jgi:hypothetical protein